MSLFIGTKEIHFFNQINKELIQKIVNQKIVYFSVSDEHTKSNDLYKESIKKTVFKPVEINARILYKEPKQTNDNFTIDTIFEMEAYFHLDELYQRNINPQEGDFIKWGKVVYEIKNLTSPQLTYGKVEEEVMVKAECVVSRKSQFEVTDDTQVF